MKQRTRNYCLKRLGCILLGLYFLYFLFIVRDFYSTNSALPVNNADGLPFVQNDPIRFHSDEEAPITSPENIAESATKDVNLASVSLKTESAQYSVKGRTNYLTFYADSHIVQLYQVALEDFVFDHRSYRETEALGEDLLTHLDQFSELFGRVENIIKKKNTHRRLRDKGKKDIQKKAVIIGEPAIIKRDSETYIQAFEDEGFSAKTAAELIPSVASGRVEANLRAIRRIEWDVALCLSLHTEKCLNKIDFARTEANSLQKVNRIAGLKAVLWAKDSFCRSIRSAAPKWVGVFTFPCWILPREFDSLLQFSKKSTHMSFIVKPFSQGGGKGIFVIDRIDANVSVSLKKSKHLIQPYLGSPHLLSGRKWDMRVYVAVTSLFPLRAYLHMRGLVRLSSQKYNATAKSGGNKSQYLTNTSVNKRYASSMDDITWSFEKLRRYLGTKKYSVLFQRVQTAVAMTLLSSLRSFAKYYEKLSPSGVNPATRFRCSNCYHLLGVDLIADHNLHPRVIEVNGEPSMQLSKDGTHYDNTKIQMQRDLVQLMFTEPKDDLKQLLFSDIMQMTLKRPSQEYYRILKDNKPFAKYLLEMKNEALNIGEFRRIFPPSSPCLFQSHRTLWDEFLSQKSVYQHLGSEIEMETIQSLECVRIKSCMNKQDLCSEDLKELKNSFTDVL